MAGDTDNPRIWINADVYVADVGVTAPTTTTAALDAAYEALGLLSDEDGMTMHREDEVRDHYAWGSILVRQTRSKHKRTVQVTALEDNDVVFRLVNPGSYAEGGAAATTTRRVYVPTPDRKAFLFELVDGDITKRLVIPTGEVTEVGDTPIKDNEMAKVQLTITVYPDADGLLYTELTDDPAAEPSGS